MRVPGKGQRAQATNSSLLTLAQTGHRDFRESGVLTGCARGTGAQAWATRATSVNGISSKQERVRELLAGAQALAGARANMRVCSRIARVSINVRAQGWQVAGGERA
jgi:hypothetical protein